MNRKVLLKLDGMRFMMCNRERAQLIKKKHVIGKGRRYALYGDSKLRGDIW